VVTVVDGGGNESCGFGVSTGNSQEVGAWYMLELILHVKFVH
jgi:hypothetical protein